MTTSTYSSSRRRAGFPYRLGFALVGICLFAWLVYEAKRPRTAAEIEFAQRVEDSKARREAAADQRLAETIARNQLMAGMGRAQVEQSWGRPRSRNLVNNGVIEHWHWHTRYARFENGRLAVWSEDR